MKVDAKTRKLIYKLKEEKGLTFGEIVNTLEDMGIKLAMSAVYYNYKKACDNKEIFGTIEDKSSKDISDEKIYELRNLGLSYECIADFFNSIGINIVPSTIHKRCKKIYKEKGQDIPISKYSFRILNKIDDFKKKKFSYIEIASEISKNGKRISVEDIENICTKVLNKKFIKPPKEKLPNNGFVKKEVPEEIIFELRELGLSYKKIAENLTKAGFPVSRNTIRNTCKELYSEKTGKSKLKREIAKPENTEVSSLEELDELAQAYLAKKIATNELLIGYKKLENKELNDDKLIKNER